MHRKITMYVCILSLSLYYLVYSVRCTSTVCANICVHKSTGYMQQWFLIITVVLSLCTALCSGQFDQNLLKSAVLHSAETLIFNKRTFISRYSVTCKDLCKNYQYQYKPVASPGGTWKTSARYLKNLQNKKPTPQPAMSRDRKRKFKLLSILF